MPKFQYRLADHLGNTVVFFEDKNNNGCITTEEEATSAADLEIVQRLLYYPFGMALEGLGAWNAQPWQQYRYNGKERDTLTGWYDYGARWGLLDIGRWNAVDPLADQRVWVSPYNYVQNNPISRVDPTGAIDDWYKDADGEVKYDERIKSQSDLNKLGIKGTYLSPEKYDRVVINAIGADIISGGWETFIKYYENSDLGKFYFMNAAWKNYSDNASGIMGFVAGKIDGVREAIRVSMMTHSWVAQAGWTEGRNQLEHHIGMFLMADVYGPEKARNIGEWNEYRGFWINDRQSGNMLNALIGRPGTAFELRDLRHNNEGIDKWYRYNNRDPRTEAFKYIPKLGTLEYEIIR